MKKFLFTLAALLMAGSMYADCYFQPADFEIPQDKIGVSGAAGNVEIPVTAVFEEYVSAWECVVNLPDGLNLFGVKKGTTYPIDYFNDMGEASVASPDITRNGTKFIVACAAGAYSEDGDYYGVAKWAPNTYENFLILVVRAAADFAGGELSMTTTFSCGQDTRPEVNDNRVNNTVAYSSPEAAEITVETTVTPPAKPTYWTSKDADNFYIHFELDEEAEEGTELVIYAADGVTVVDQNPVIIARPDYDPTAEDVHAVYSAEAVLDGVASEKLYVDEIVPQKDQVLEPTATPTISTEETEEGVVITVTGDGHVILYVEDMQVAEGDGTVTYTLKYEDYEEGEEVGVSATAQADGMGVSDYATETIEIPATLKGAINIGEVDQETGKIEISYNGEEDVTLTVNGEKVRMTETTYQLEDYGTWDVTVTATAEGYLPKTKTEQRTWNAPTPQGQTAAPEVVTTPGDDAYTITGQVKEGDPEAEVSIYLWDEETQDWVPVANPFIVNRTDEDQTIKVKVVAHIDGQEDGETIMDILVPAKPEEPETGVNELMNGKTVAGVRYFNLAGQEMQEANGVTIVVTTYTDGTTSAVKVMK